MKKIIISLLLALALVSYGLTRHFAVIPSDEPLTLTIDHRPTEMGRFMRKHKCPKEYIKEFINAADRYNIDYRLLVAISVQESSCFKHYPPDSNNPFGWASARTGFETIPGAINYVSGQLGNGKYYTKKTLDQKLRAYNPNPEYAPKIKKLMNEMQPIEKYNITI